MRHSSSGFGIAQVYNVGRLAYRTCFLSAQTLFAETREPACLCGQFRSRSCMTLHSFARWIYICDTLAHVLKPPRWRLSWYQTGGQGCVVVAASSAVHKIPESLTRTAVILHYDLRSGLCHQTGVFRRSLSFTGRWAAGWCCKKIFMVPVRV